MRKLSFRVFSLLWCVVERSATDVQSVLLDLASGMRMRSTSIDKFAGQWLQLHCERKEGRKEGRLVDIPLLRSLQTHTHATVLISLIIPWLTHTHPTVLISVTDTSTDSYTLQYLSQSLRPWLTHYTRYSTYLSYWDLHSHTHATVLISVTGLDQVLCVLCWEWPSK
jgi:hypothetical protein